MDAFYKYPLGIFLTLLLIIQNTLATIFKLLSQQNLPIISQILDFDLNVEQNIFLLSNNSRTTLTAYQKLLSAYLEYLCMQNIERAANNFEQLLDNHVTYKTLIISPSFALDFISKDWNKKFQRSGLKYYLKHNNSINQHTFLSYSIKHRHMRSLELYLTLINKQCTQYKNALLLAIESGNDDVCEILAEFPVFLEYYLDITKEKSDKTAIAHKMITNTINKVLTCVRAKIQIDDTKANLGIIAIYYLAYYAPTRDIHTIQQLLNNEFISENICSKNNEYAFKLINHANFNIDYELLRLIFSLPNMHFANFNDSLLGKATYDTLSNIVSNSNDIELLKIISNISNTSCIFASKEISNKGYKLLNKSINKIDIFIEMYKIIKKIVTTFQPNIFSNQYLLSLISYDEKKASVLLSNLGDEPAFYKIISSLKHSRTPYLTDHVENYSARFIAESLNITNLNSYLECNIDKLHMTYYVLEYITTIYIEKQDYMHDLKYNFYKKALSLPIIAEEILYRANLEHGLTNNSKYINLLFLAIRSKQNTLLTLLLQNNYISYYAHARDNAALILAIVELNSDAVAILLQQHSVILEFLEHPLNIFKQEINKRSLQHIVNFFTKKSESLLAHHYDKAKNLTIELLKYLIKQPPMFSFDIIKHIKEITNINCVQNILRENKDNILYALIQQARTNKQNAIVLILFKIDNNLTIYQNDFIGNKPNISFADDSQNAHTALSAFEEQSIQNAKKKYIPNLPQDLLNKFYKETVDSLINYLASAYNKEPAFFINNNQEKITLPLQWIDFHNLCISLDLSDITSAYSSYYKHTIHTAWRYLQIPNYWIANDAQNVQVKLQGKYSYFNYYINIIAILWLGVSDSNEPVIDNIDTKSRIAIFIQGIAEINRSNNNDYSEGDRPVCYGGTMRALYNCVINHSIIKANIKTIINTHVQEFVYDYYSTLLSNYSRQELDNLKNDINDYILNNIDISNIPNIPIDNIKKFLNRLESKYSFFFNNIKEFDIIKKLTNQNQKEPLLIEFYCQFNLEYLFNTWALQNVESNNQIKRPSMSL